MPSNTSSLTPMMQQYMEIKDNNPHTLLFYRMGDFYELFFDDALKASKALDITLTKRGKINDEDIPMAGVPVHSHEIYLQRLIKKGFRVAICEQTETPEMAKKRAGKTLIHRDVVRIITPGTLTEDTLLDARSSNYLCALGEDKKSLALSWMDLSTGEIYVQSTNVEKLPALLNQLSPKELLISDHLEKNPTLNDFLWEQWKDILIPLSHQQFHSEKNQQHLKNFYQIDHLSSFGKFDPCHISAAGALVHYLSLTQKQSLGRLSPLQRVHSDQFMLIDEATQRHLELTQTLEGEKKGTLLDTIDYTCTPAGSRHLCHMLVNPLREVQAIEKRLQKVNLFFEKGELREKIRQLLKECPDIQRPLSRLSLQRGTAKDLAHIRDALSVSFKIFNLLKSELCEQDHEDFKSLWGHGELLGALKKALQVDPPAQMKEGQFIVSGFSSALDELRNMSVNGQSHIHQLQSLYRQQAKTTHLKIKHNHLLGYFIEIPIKHAEKVNVQTFIHRQTLSNAIRYGTDELNQWEHKLNKAQEQALHLEFDIFYHLQQQVLDHYSSLMNTSQTLAKLDIFNALAHLAEKSNYVRPKLDESLDFHIEHGRHPVVEGNMSSRNGSFSPNSCSLNTEKNLWLITGPNMAGKSTFLRQNALIVILAQMGSFVPAQSARIGLVDQIFSRVGARDNVSRGQSTFMVEMTETAAILNQATSRSFVILDEIGRGTSTQDGLSLAWSILEYVHNHIGCRGFFSTHYHELYELTLHLDRLSSHFMQTQEWKNSIIFLHKIQQGHAPSSYGLHVAKLAGLPHQVIKKAGEFLNHLNGNHLDSKQDQPSQMTLLSNPQEPSAQILKLQKAIENLNPDQMTPQQSLEFLYELKNQFSSS